jgi:hypothetical protein
LKAGKWVQPSKELGAMFQVHFTFPWQYDLVFRPMHASTTCETPLYYGKCVHLSAVVIGGGFQMQWRVSDEHPDDASGFISNPLHATTAA